MKNRTEGNLLYAAFQTSDDDCLSIALFSVSFRNDIEDDDEKSPYLENGAFFCIVPT